MTMVLSATGISNGRDDALVNGTDNEKLGTLGEEVLDLLILLAFRDQRRQGQPA